MPKALVTGANRGIGLEVSSGLVAKGFEVFLGTRDRDAGRTAAQKLGPMARAVTLDVADPESVSALAATLATEAPLDVLVNNAGTTRSGFNAEVARETLEVNYFGAARVTLAMLPHLSPSANLVMVSSGMGELSSASPELRARLLDPNLTREELEAMLEQFVEDVRAGRPNLGGFPKNAYSVSKIAMNALTRILARELPRTQRVNAVCPGWVRTRMGGPAASRSVERGASGILWAATLGEGGPTGGFFRDGKAIGW